MLYTNGFYRVAQKIRWYRRAGRMPGYNARARWVKHYPGRGGPNNDRFCLIQ